MAWARRPQAAALVAQLTDPGRGWDPIVIGEYERAFYGSQYAAMAPLFEHYGTQLWMPERSPGPASGSAPRWPPRPGSRAATSAAVRRTDTGLLMRGRTRTKRTPHGGAVPAASNRTRTPRPWCGGYSPSAWPATAPPGSPGR